MRKLTSLLLVIGALFLYSCGGDKPHKNANITVKNDAGLRTGDGLDLQAVGEIVKKSANAEEIEKELNKKGGVNNLDLNEDGYPDYINVQEKGEGNVTLLSLTTSLSEGDVQEIATIEIDLNKGSQQADVYISGNQHIYGSGHSYHSHYSASQMLLMAYLLRPHPYYYHRPYYPGYYPTYYRPYRTVPRATYRTRTRAVTKTSTVKKLSPSAASARKPKITSPNANKNSKTVKARSFKDQKKGSSLKTRNKARDNTGGGFGKKSTSKTGTSTSSRKSTSTPSRTSRSSSSSRSSYSPSRSSSSSRSSSRSSSSRSSSRSSRSSRRK